VSLWRLMMVAAALLCVVPAACSTASSPPVTPTHTPSPTSTPSGAASPTPVPTPTPTPTAIGQPTPTPAPSPTPSPTPLPTSTPTPTPSPTPVHTLSASLTTIVVCAQAQQTCGVDLDGYAATGEEAAVLVKGATGTLTFSNTGGASIATITDQVYSSTPTSTEYEVFYKTATASATTDSLTIGDSGGAQLVIPVTIVSPGDDEGPDFFALDTTSGTVCPTHQITFGTAQQGGATIVLSTSDSTLVSIAQDGGANFILTLLRAGSGTVTATAGSASVVYPVNVPVAGFTSTC
jgi:hypothetical protein